MARTQNVYVKGKLSWVRPDKPDPWGNYKATIHPDPESLNIIRGLLDRGLKNKLGQDEDGYNMTFRRPTQKVIKGKVVAFSPVEVLDGTKDKLPDGSYFPWKGEAIGNGSDGVLKLQVYEHPTPSGGKAIAARLEAVRVDNHIPFQKDDFTKFEERQIGALADQPREELF
jgi:hypothetical protein